MTYCYIDTDSAMESLNASLSTSSNIFLDTEFIRVSTYYPKLGLLQLHNDGRDYLIDPLAVNNLQRLICESFDTDKLFVLHSCKEDLDVLQSNLGFLPERIFDTQVAASFLNMGASLGYAALVDKICNIHLEKDQTLTDWLARPLTEAQKKYAAADVTYLTDLYHQLSDQLIQTGKERWFEEEMQSLIAAKKSTVDIESVYLDISGAWMLSPAELAILKELASWRYQSAVSLDKPLSFVLKEDIMIELAKRQPKTERELMAAGLPASHKARYGKQLLVCIEKGLSYLPEAYPAKIKRMIDFPHYKHDFKHVKQIVEKAAHQHELPAELIGSRKIINQYLLWRYENGSSELLPKLLTGWRGDVLAELKDVK